MSKHIEIIYGIHAVAALLRQSQQNILSLTVLEGRHDRALAQILTQAHTQGISIQTAPRKTFDKLLSGKTHQGVMAQCRVITTQEYSEADIPDLLAQVDTSLILILDGIQDPHNLGACLRVADAAGVNLVIAPKDHSVGLTPVVRKVASGAAETVPYIQVSNLARTMQWLRDQSVWLYGATEDSPTRIYQADLKGSVGIVMGGEQKGLRRLTQEHCDQLLSIPMLGSVESLNVSVAAGICLFEVVRQRSGVSKNK